MTDASRAATLNSLLNGELHAAHVYWQAGAWCAARHLDGCADFLITHADEELQHMRRMFGYMIDSELPVVFAALPAPNIDAENVLELFKMILGHEQSVTDAVNAAVKEAADVGDQSTFEFLQWFVMEQRGEMKLFRNIVDRITLIGEGPQALFFVDQEVAKIATTAADPVAQAPTTTV